MTAMTLDRREPPAIDRAAIRLGTTLIAWGRRRTEKRRGREAVDAYRTDYVERSRTASAIVRQQLLP
ncbi:MAG: hypothetical protein ABI310_06220 [Microbacteriaceae bacterium]